MGNLWVSEFCEQAEFVVKTDDDQFVDLYEVNNTSLRSKQIMWLEYKVYTLTRAKVNSSDYKNDRFK